MSLFEVKVPSNFWRTMLDLKPKYSHREFVEAVNAVKECIAELERTGMLDKVRCDDHVLVRPAFNDGQHREAHTYDDDALVVYFIRECRRVIRMVGVFDHRSIPSG